MSETLDCGCIVNGKRYEKYCRDHSMIWRKDEMTNPNLEAVAEKIVDWFWGATASTLQKDHAKRQIEAIIWQESNSTSLPASGLEEAAKEISHKFGLHSSVAPTPENVMAIMQKHLALPASGSQKECEWCIKLGDPEPGPNGSPIHYSPMGGYVDCTKQSAKCSDNDPDKDCPCGGAKGTASCMFTPAPAQKEEQ